MTHHRPGPAAVSDTTVRDYYDHADVDAFYDAVWGGEDMHVGIYAGPHDAVADASHRTVRHAAGKAADLLAAGPAARVLDLGAGYGGSSRALAARFGCRVVALDLSEKHNSRHRAANARLGLTGRIEVVTGSLHDVPYRDGEFDVVWSLEVLCHLADREAALREAVRVLKPGGALVFTDVMAAEGAPPEALRPATSRLDLPPLATPAYYLDLLASLGLVDVGFEDRSADVERHYSRLDEEVTYRAEELAGVISPPYLAGLRENLPRWTEAAARGLLRWGIFHARRPAAGG